MFRTLLLVGLFLSSAMEVQAQTDQELVDRVLLASPARLRDDATVVGWRDDGSRVTLKAGSNGLVCWDQSGEPRKRTYASRCTSEANLPRLEQNRVWNMSGKSREEIQAMMDEADKNGTREVSEFGSVYYSVNSETADIANLHMTIAVPYATSASLGVPSARTNEQVWLMGAGTSTAHLMIPGR